MYYRGGSRIFIGGGGGGAKDYVRPRTSWARTWSLFDMARVQGLLKGLGSSRFFDALSCYMYLSLIFKHFCIQTGIENIVDPFFFFGGGARLLCPPLNGMHHCTKVKWTIICLQVNIYYKVFTKKPATFMLRIHVDFHPRQQGLFKLH